MAGNREGKVEKLLDRMVRDLGGLTRKWTSPGHTGVPDRIVIINGRVDFVEVKTTKGKLTEYQERERKRLRAVGANVFTVRGEQGVIDYIEGLRRG